jgi:hypothetical protein
VLQTENFVSRDLNFLFGFFEDCANSLIQRKGP